MRCRWLEKEQIVVQKSDKPAEEMAAGWWIEREESVTWKREVMDRPATGYS